jgi:hypothetical protein
MRRLAFNAAATLSLLLCLFLIYSCLRSFIPSPLRFESVDGSLMIMWSEGSIPADPSSDPFNPANDKFFGIPALMRMMRINSDKQCLGFRSISGGGMFHGQTYQILAIPYWALIPPTAILPALWLLSRRRHRHRLKSGHCLCCGYDLRESKEKCPECGTAVKPAVS